MRMHKLLATLILGGISFSGFSQSLLVTDADQDQANPLDCSIFNNGSVTNFFDSGNNTGPYGPNENETIVICPDLVNGSKVSLAFATNAGYMWDVDGSDTVYVYDGPNTSAPLLGAINSVSHPNGATFQASFANNPSGCLTVVFVSDGAVEGDGWDANVTCGNPPQPFEAHMVAYINGDIAGGNDMAPLDTGYVDVCQGDSIMFIATPVFPYDSAITGTGYDQQNNHDNEWAFSDGTTAQGDTVWFVPGAAQGYLVTLTTSDHFPQSEIIIAKIRVSTTPSFASCTPLSDTICLGSATGLVGGVGVQDTAGVDPTQSSIIIGGSYAGLTYLPDGSGQVYTTDVNISGYPAGTQISSAADIVSMCVTMEHSFLGDLEMTLECPNGTTATIFNSYSGGGELVPGGFNGGGTFLGEAFDNNIGNPGIGWEYCFYDGAPSGSWATGYPTVPVTNPPSPANGNSIPAGDYEPEQTFGALAGCPINGSWTITVQDNLGIDDGYIFEWGIVFDPTLNPNNETYAPTIISGDWVSHPDIITNTDTSVIVIPSDTGDNFYTFAVTDDFGCYYDTTIMVHTLLGAEIMPNASACDNMFQVSGTSSLAGGTWFEVNGGGVASFSPSASDDNPNISVTESGLYLFGYVDNQCQDTLFVAIDFIADPEVSLLDTLICEGDVYTMDATNPSSTYQWFLDGLPIVGATNATYGAVVEGMYMVAVQNQCNAVNASAEVETDPCVLVVPNVFTPNSDGVNDVFEVTGIEIYIDPNLEVYNRWGQLVYKSEQYDNTWDGRDMNGNELSDGTYYYLLNATRPFTLEEKKFQGTVNIFRKY